MGRIPWEKFFTIPIKEINNQHKKIVDFINETYDNLDKGSLNLKEFDNFYGRLENFADWHFGTEEKYFDQFNYPDALGHIAEHNKIKGRIQELEKKFFAQRDTEVIFETLNLFDDWLFHHLMEFDKKYVDFFLSHGLK